MTKPKEMEQYLKHYGWHFSKRAADYAASMMWSTDENGREKEVDAPSREELQQILIRNKVELDNDKLYDSVYVAAMCKADFMEGKDAAIEDEQHLARYVKRVIDDPDALDGELFATWAMRMRAKDEPIDWEMMM